MELINGGSTPQPASAQLDHVKLNKVLWYSDAATFIETGDSITDSKYIRKPRGPVSKYLPSAVVALESADIVTTGRAFDSDRGIWFHTIEVTGSVGADSEFNVESLLSPKERATLDRCFKKVCLENSADSISDRTHGNIWDVAADGEEIPLFAVYAEELGRITKEDVALAFEG
jgi:hypothetical protein